VSVLLGGAFQYQYLLSAFQESLTREKAASRRPREDISRERKEGKEREERKDLSRERKEGREEKKEGRINLKTEVENLSRELEERDKIIAR